MFRKFLVLVFAGLASTLAHASAPVVRVVADESVLQGRLEKLRDLGAAAGVRVEWAYLNAFPEPPQQWIAAADLLIVEAPLQSARQRIDERVGDVLARASAPRVEATTRRESYSHLPERQGRTLIEYYRNGGEANLRNFFAYFRAWHAKEDPSKVAPPMVVPVNGYYHPDAPRLFATLDDYIEWGKQRWKPSAPRVALAIHASAFATLQTQVIDAVIRRSEALGQMPLPFWFDSEDADALKKALQPARADVLINMQHMGNGRARMREFEQLRIPVLQTLNYRDGNIEEWKKEASGAPSRLVAPFIAVYETWGMSDPLVIAAVDDGVLVPMQPQVDAVLRKASALAKLRHMRPDKKRLALMFWNYPQGEKNFSASNLNVPRSLESLTRALNEAGYEVPPATEQQIIETGQALLSVLYHHDRLDELLQRGLAATLPVKTYSQWLASTSPSVRSQMRKRWGDPQDHWAVRQIGGEKQFVIPRWQLGNLLLMPQMPRGGAPGEGYHDGALPPDHLYMAAYLYVRESGPHALIHFGTHGTQEWLPGKDRGLSVDDYPMLAVGDLPVFYPYIQDNIGEALQAKRRGRAVIVSHQTPPFAPSGLYKELAEVHALLHEYIQLDPGAVRDRTAENMRRLIVEHGLHKDMDWTEQAMREDFDGFLTAFHDHLHGLAQRSVPLGLHTLGKSPSPEHRLSTVVQQLGDEFANAVAAARAPTVANTVHPPGHVMAGAAGADSGGNEFFTGNASQLASTPPYQLLQRHLREQAPLSEANASLRPVVERAVKLDRHLATNHELSALLDGLAGYFVPPGPGGDPVRNPEVPNGRNLFGFEPDKLPTRSAFDAAEAALNGLVADYRAKHGGASPTKLAFSLWSVEAMRHMGITESQVLHAMGLRPRWDEGGRVTALDIIPASELGRPRIDAVVQVTGAYRDQFENFMRLLADATERLSKLEEPGNVIAKNTQAAILSLKKQGMDAAQAERMAAVRLFGNQPGDYGVGLSDAVLDSTAWENDAPLAEQYLARLQYAYGSKDWGVSAGKVNVYAEQLKGVQAAVLSRSSNLYGVLTGDDPFQFLGGLSLAVRHLNGASPELYISDQRRSQGRMVSAASFLSEEMRTRYLNPQWIKPMQAEGYAGTLEIVDTFNNLFGWQALDPATVRADQWQAMHDVYVMDRHQLDMQEWFEQNNLMAQAQILERMLEAVRKGYWDASEQTRREIAERWQELADQGVTTGAATTREFAQQMAAGFGLQPGNTTPNASPSAQSDVNTAASASAQTVRGQVLKEAVQQTPPEPLWRVWLALLALVVCFASGGVRQARHSSPFVKPA
ncbi:cobaltochelatase subunit CobN [Steroidobacter agaridevorans]|uniref:cobaltochelatase subunit CobN n=1 Tax=Steroidobacter agaridevorans TaxID=2695856 RepID=UPI001323B3A9|nr:cobaltochelatase subunit CobN [Steroidobacter agaridevorans]GFE91719.1 cobaltochelatase subunit CobN [Steroidobacter agaridevorans]